MRLCRKDLNATIVVLLILGVVIVSLPIARHLYYVTARRPSVKDNMYAAQLAAEVFCEMAAGHYPAGINVTVEEVTGISSDSSEGLFSISGAKRSDPVSQKDIGSTGPILLPENFRNWHIPSGPALATSSVDPPVWSPEVRGMVFYVPLDIEGKTARRYKVYGAGRYRLLRLVLSSED